MKNNAIVILNIVGLPKIVPVENFDKKSIKEAIKQTLQIDVENLECLSNIDSIIYGVKEFYPKLQRELTSVNIYYSEYPRKHHHYIRLITAIL